MIRFALSKKEAFFLLLALESFLSEAEESELEPLESCLAKLQSFSLASPFKTATEARYSRS